MCGSGSDPSKTRQNKSQKPPEDVTEAVEMEEMSDERG
jgi:hypothetical protein